MDCDSADEYESGRHPEKQDSDGNAGKSVLCTEFPSVFYDPDRIFPGRISRGPCL